MKQWEFPSSAEWSCIHPVLAWMESEGGSGLFCFMSGQQIPFSPWVLFGKILPQLPHKQMNSLASVFLRVPNIGTSLNCPDPPPPNIPQWENGWIWHASMHWRTQIPFLMCTPLPNHSCLDYPAFHTSLFCSHCKSKRPVPQISAATREGECDLFLVISIEKKKKKCAKDRRGMWHSRPGSLV